MQALGRRQYSGERARGRPAKKKFVTSYRRPPIGSRGRTRFASAPLNLGVGPFASKEGKSGKLMFLALGLNGYLGGTGLKNFIIFVVVVAGAVYAWRAHREAEARALDEARNPDVISNPTYAEVRAEMDYQGRSTEAVLFAKTVDQADCEKYAPAIQKLLLQPQDNGATWTFKSSKCSPDISSRNAVLFENKPTFVTYLSFARGDRHEREARLIYWGVTVEESDRLCDGVSNLQSGWKGTVTCVRAPRG
jgi:hypothetical protein